MKFQKSFQCTRDINSAVTLYQSSTLYALIDVFRKRSILKITDLQPEDSGTYVCKAKSPLGEATIDFKVSVKQIKTKEKKAEVARPLDDWIPCPISNFCLNESQCRLYPLIGEMICL